MHRACWLFVMAVAVAVAAPACSSSDGQGTTLTVLAASSLRPALTSLAQDYEAAHTGVHVRVSYGGSDVLVAQVSAGAPADLLATADARTMQTAESAHLVDGAPLPLAANTLVVAVPRKNPTAIRTLEDLTKPHVRVALCESTV